MAGTVVAVGVLVGWYCRCRVGVMSTDVLMTGMELSLSIADALMDSSEGRLGPSNEIRCS